MGCDIHTIAERKVDGKYEAVTESAFPSEYGGPSAYPFEWRSYGMFGFLADVRNYSDVTPISSPRGWPKDASSAANTEYMDWSGDAHNHSWLSVDELSAFDYDSPMEDRRVGRQISENIYSGAETAEPGGGKTTTYREFLGPDFFRDIEILKSLGADRVLFFFDN